MKLYGVGTAPMAVGRIEKGYRFRTQGEGRGGALTVEITDFPALGCVGELGRAIPDTAKRLGCETLVLFCRGSCRRQAVLLAQEVRRHWTGELCASPCLGLDACRLVLPAVSGGTLEDYLNREKRAAGSQSIALWLCPVRMDFRLPEKSGTGTALNPEEVKALLEQYRPGVFFSRELCTRYFSYRGGDGTHFVLTDNEDTLREKCRLGERLGVRAAFRVPES